MWKKMAYNMFMGQINEKMRPNQEQIEQKKKNEERLVELRKKQGNALEFYKDELMQELNMDIDKAIKLNGKVDTNIYNV